MSSAHKILLPALVILIIASYACNRSQNEPEPVDGTSTIASTPTPTPTPITPDAVLSLSGNAMAEVSSFHFEIEHEEGGTPLAQNIVLEEAHGEVVRPDKIAIDFAGVAGSFAIKGSLVTVGETTYMTNPLNGDWQPVPPGVVSPLAFFNPSQGIAAMMSQVEGARFISQDERSYRIGGTISATALVSLFGEVDQNASIDVELVIDAKSYYLKQVMLDGHITPTEVEGVVRNITLTHFNNTIDIEIPQ